MFFTATDNVPELAEAIDAKAESVAEMFTDWDRDSSSDDPAELVYGYSTEKFCGLLNADDEEGDEVYALEHTYVLASGGPGIKLVVLERERTGEIVAAKVVGTSLAGKLVLPVSVEYQRLAEHLISGPYG